MTEGVLNAIGILIIDFNVMDDIGQSIFNLIKIKNYSRDITLKPSESYLEFWQYD